MKNLRNVIANFATIIIGALVYVFMACPYSTTTFLTQTSSVSLFEMMEAGTMSDALGLVDYTGYNLAVVFGYILAVFAAILILVAIVNLLVDFGVIKNKNAAKILKFVDVVSAIVLAISALIVLIGVSAFIGANNAGESTALGWAAIVNLIIAVVAVVSAFAVKVSTKKSK